MIRREYKTLKLFIVTAIALFTTWQGKRNAAWSVEQISGQDCVATWLLIKCQ